MRPYIGIQDRDILIMRVVGTSTAQIGEPTRQLFSLHRAPMREKFAGPMDEQTARDKALALARAEGVQVWLEMNPNSGAYQLLSD